MPTPTNKSRQNLGSLFARNAIPTEGDFADLIASCLNLTDDGVLKLPDQSLGLVRQRPASTAPANQRPVLSLFEEAGGQAAWEIQLQNSSGKSGFALADQTKNAKLFLDKNTGNLGIGTSDPQAKLHVGGSMRVDTDLTILGDLTATGRVEIGGTATATKAPNSKLGSTGQAAIRGTVSQLDFIDNDANQLDWAIRVDQSKLSFVRAPAVDTTLVLQSNGNVGVGTNSPTEQLHVAGGIRAAGTIRAIEHRISAQGFEFELKDGLLTPIVTPQFTQSTRQGKKVEDTDFRTVYSYNATNDGLPNNHVHHILTIPAGVEWIFIKLWGAGGGAGVPGCWDHGADGGGGGHTRGLFRVVPGEQLIIVVGRGGTTTNGTTRPYGGGGTNQGELRGFNDNFGGHGGGFCGLFKFNTSLSQARALAIAGGGGGGGSSRIVAGNVGGAGGGISGQRGASPFDGKFTAGGSGGTQTQGGRAGFFTGAGSGSDGAALQGGASAATSNSGAGGGGYFGGGGGAYHENKTMGGGGGGSGFVSSSGLLAGTYTGHFRVPAFSWDPDLLSDLAGVEALGFGGQNRDAKIWYSTQNGAQRNGVQSGGHAHAVIYF